jgi:hypothetical protein
MQDSWLQTFSLQYRKDTFYQSGSAGENANKITFHWSNLLLTNPAKTKSVLIDTAYTNNKAKDDTYTYTRYDLSGLYIT